MDSNPDHKPYLRFTGKQRIDSCVNTLRGIIEGIAIDGHINEAEVGFLGLWLESHQDVRDRHPFNELIARVEESLTDGVLTEDEHQDIIWLCDRLEGNGYYKPDTADMQRLHAIVGGIIADGKVSERELRSLSSWLLDHEHLRCTWPYEEIGALTTNALVDGIVSSDEEAEILAFFGQFAAILDDKTIHTGGILADGKIVGLCAVCPEIEFDGKIFAFTGASSRHTRNDLSTIVESLGGKVAPGPSKKVDYLIVGSDGNPCWAYACYGRKVEQAVQLRKAGVKIMLIHEADFHDAVQDQR